MADLSTLRDSLGEVEFFLLKDWTSFQRELFLAYRDTDDSLPGTVVDTPLRLAARADVGAGYRASGGNHARRSRIRRAEPAKS
jgi:hypothetical protein